ncbi:MAG TPA: DUF1292 domain-containing protein [Bacilli bacterium]|nr:DUF1292 domain-containing protein [Bacilli bacterium]
MKEENNEKTKNVFKVINDKGEEVDCEVLFTFDSDETKKSYIAYTDNTLDEAGNVKVYASIYDKTGESKDLQPIETEKEWQIIENIFSKLQDKIGEEDNPS